MTETVIIQRERERERPWGQGGKQKDWPCHSNSFPRSFLALNQKGNSHQRKSPADQRGTDSTVRISKIKLSIFVPMMQSHILLSLQSEPMGHSLSVEQVKVPFVVRSHEEPMLFNITQGHGTLWCQQSRAKAE